MKSVLIEYSSSRSCVVSPSALLDASESVWADMKDKSKERNRNNRRERDNENGDAR